MEKHRPSDQGPPPGFSQRWLDLGPERLRLVQGGPAQAPALVLVHGLGGSAEDFFGLAPRLSRTRRCFIPDLPGFGLSSLADTDYGIQYFANVLERLAAALGLARPAWAGHSMGGHIVLWLAAHRPGLVERVAAICPSGGQNGPSRRHRMLLGALVRGERFLAYNPWLARQSVAWVFGELWRTRRGTACRQVQERIVSLWGGFDRGKRERALIRSARRLLEEPVFKHVQAIKAPVLLVAGRGDRIVPRLWTDRLRLHLPAGVKYLEVQGGHMPVYLAVDELGRALDDFLSTPPS